MDGDAYESVAADWHAKGRVHRDVRRGARELDAGRTVSQRLRGQSHRAHWRRPPDDGGQERLVWTGAAGVRRWRRELARRGRDSIRRRPRPFGRADLVRAARSARAGPALCRRRSRCAVRQRRWRWGVAGDRVAHESSDARELVSRRRRPDGALDRVRCLQALAADRRRLGRRRVPLRRRRRLVDAEERRRARRLSSRQIPRGGAVRAPHGDAPAAAGSAVPAEPLRRLSQRRRRRFVERHLEWFALAFRIPFHHPAARWRYRLRHSRGERPGADDGGRTIRHLPQPQSRRVVGPADQRVAAVRRVSERDADGDDDRSARRAGRLRRYQGGHLLASRDGGDSWQVVFNWLPPVYSLETAVV